MCVKCYLRMVSFGDMGRLVFTVENEVIRSAWMTYTCAEIRLHYL